MVLIRLVLPQPVGGPQRGRSLRRATPPVGPRWRGGTKNEPELLASCYRACLAVAHDHQVRSIAFPAISTGAFAYPLLPACRIAVSECLTFLASDTTVSEIVLVGFAKEDVAALRRALAEVQLHG